MRSALAAVATLVAITALASTFASPAMADAKDDEFVAAMEYVGIVSDDGATGLIHLAHVVCNDKANGWSDATAASMVNDANPGLGMRFASYLVAAAEHVYCPQFSNPSVDPPMG